jgi:MinD-like ATPase involved in chromosome partitioning or flagellar assembly
VRNALERVTAERHERGIRSPKDLIAQVGELDAEAGEALQQEAERFHPGILVNRVESPEHRRLADDIGIACRDYFGTDIATLGALPRDPLVGVSVQRRQLACSLFPESTFMRAIRELAERLAV